MSARIAGGDGNDNGDSYFIVIAFPWIPKRTHIVYCHTFASGICLFVADNFLCKTLFFSAAVASREWRCRWWYSGCRRRRRRHSG